MSAFEDYNGNGIRDGEDYNVGEFTVILQSLDPNGTSSTGVVDPFSGYVVFNDVAPGTYRLLFNASTLFEHVFSPQDQGTDDDLDSDVDAYGQTDPFTVLAGEFNDSFAAGLHWVGFGNG